LDLKEHTVYVPTVNEFSDSGQIMIISKHKHLIRFSLCSSGSYNSAKQNLMLTV